MPREGDTASRGAAMGREMRVTIRTKIFATAVALLFLMFIASSFGTRLAREVGNQLHHVADEYLPAFGAISDGATDSLEAGLALRRLFIVHSHTPVDVETAKQYRAVLIEKLTAFDKELARA